jgi:hypothetical protein
VARHYIAKQEVRSKAVIILLSLPEVYPLRPFPRLFFGLVRAYSALNEPVSCSPVGNNGGQVSTKR